MNTVFIQSRDAQPRAHLYTVGLSNEDRHVSPQPLLASCRIKENIRYLHWVLLGEDISAGSVEEQATYDLFLAVLSEGQNMLANREQYDPQPSDWLEWECRARWMRQADGRTDGDLPSEERIEQDEYYSIRAWMAVLTYLMSDYRFVYE